MFRLLFGVVLVLALAAMTAPPQAEATHGFPVVGVPFRVVGVPVVVPRRSTTVVRRNGTVIQKFR